MSSKLFIFNKTSYQTTNSSSFLNHVKSWCNKNNSDLNNILKENYIYYNGSQLCIHCKNEPPYRGFIKGFDSVCSTHECYEAFVASNINYYMDIARDGSFTDLYDSIYYKKSFTKIYFNRTTKIFKTYNICECCKTEFVSSRSKSCSKECQSKIQAKTRKNSKIKQLNLEYGWLIDSFDLTDSLYIKRLNHHINTLGNIKTLPHWIKAKIKNNYLLVDPIGKICYYSKFYDLYFYKTNKGPNTLKIHLGDDYEQYHKTHHFYECFANCKACDALIFKIDAFGQSRSNLYCNHNCYYDGIRLGHYPPTDERKLNQSLTMKHKIAEGSFTPCVTNSWTKQRIIVGNKKYRSSWDAAFGVLHESYEYETLRIPYEYNGAFHTYIVDYVNHTDKVVIEIKPTGNSEDKKVSAKRQALVYFCNKVEYNYIEVDENWFKDFIDDSKILKLSLSLEPHILKLFLTGIGIL